MANKVQLKRSAVPGKVPATTDLDLGEIAINTYDGKAYIKKNVSGTESIVPLGGAGSGDVTGPALSTDNAITRFDGASGKLVQNSSATVDDSGNLTALTSTATGTGANKMPVGTTAQRPASPTTGMYRMNSTTGEPEWYDAGNNAWVAFRNSPSYTIEYLAVAGGGAGGVGTGASHFANGGGGAGGVIDSSTVVTAAQAYIVTIGAGAPTNPYSTPYTRGASGSNTTLGSIATAIGGGGGGSHDATAPSGGIGGNGGSGGGGTSVGAGGSGTTGQGFNGGSGVSGGSASPGGGGGGATAAGSNSASNGGTGVGGAGLNWKSLGNHYGGGGGGSVQGSGTGAAGGIGGGGQGGGGSTSATWNGVAGTVNTGGGGGGGRNTDGTGGAGGSGIVIIRYLGAQRGSGGTVTQAGGYTYHTFASSGTFTA